MNGNMERELVAGMHEHVQGIHLTRDVAGEARRRVRRRQRVRLAVSGAGTFAAATAVILAVGVGPLGLGPQDGPAPSVAGEGTSGQPGTVDSDLQVVLHRAERAAAQQPEPSDDAYVFIHDVTQDFPTSPEKEESDTWYEARVWLSVDMRHRSVVQEREYGSGDRWSTTDEMKGPVSCPAPGEAPAAEPCGILPVTSGLPTTADAMLDWLYENGLDGSGPYDAKGKYVGSPVSRDTRAWNAAIELLQGYLPPRSQAALFAALGRIPGNSLVPEVTDGIGRTLTAVARKGDVGRTEVLFDPKTGAYRGIQSKRTGDGALPFTQLVLEQTIVQKEGQLP
jgi:hypothetical protein